MNRPKIFLTVLLAFVLVLIFTGTALAGFETERTDGRWFTLVDEKGKTIDITALPVFKGDEFIAPDNKRFKVVEIKEDTCRCQFVGVESMPVVGEKKSSPANWMALTAVIAGARPTVGIYHTHSDESYVPTDGKESAEGRGGIYKVGDTLQKTLKRDGVQVIHDRATHNPHDTNAYNRSRRTASKLMREGSLALIDVHRDAVPPQVYSARVKGKDVTRVKLVVGKQNPHMASNMEFAKRVKAYLDRNVPGLSSGIFIGKGNYNQDLTPRAMLIEVGAHTNKREDAQKGVEMFADAIPAVLGISKTPAPAGRMMPLAVGGKGQRSDWISLIWIVIVVGLAFGAYMLINRRNKTRL